MTTNTATFAHLLVGLDRAMQNVAARALAAGATQEQADAAAHEALRNHLASLA